MKWKYGRLLLVSSGVLLLGACAPDAQSTAAIPPVRNFEPARYMGVWYEIARFPHRFERGMSNVSAKYSKREDGSIQVENQGILNGKIHRVQGVAHMKGETDVGELRVSFFRPFYGDYKIIYLAPDYSSVIVTSSTKEYLWILARSPVMDEKTFLLYLEMIRKWGFDMSKMERQTPVAR